MMILIILAFTTLTTLTSISAQYVGSDLHFMPARLVYAKQAWFQALLDDNAQHRLPALYLQATEQYTCDRACWDSEYVYSYYQATTGRCLCTINEYTFAHNVVGGPEEPIDDKFETAVTFSLLNADFFAMDCYEATTGTSYHDSPGTTIEDCIASCGEPQSWRPEICIMATPTLLPDDFGTFTYEFQCQCFDHTSTSNLVQCRYGALHQYVRYNHPSNV
ncbi:uncharacterized protein L201_001071 [Kwoniella dendrophila CBS 6074]|uniref:WSC domain-containing protein n=1 Tax=Kwoniella dendrophila CBS 6074 TaxID=1295534 RepID=A0AAX4JMV3_9TREE